MVTLYQYSIQSTNVIRDISIELYYRYDAFNTQILSQCVVA